MDSWIVQGRRIGSVELDGIRQLMDAHPQWGRTHLSRHLAQQWNWRNGAAQLKDMAARTLLLKLERRGLLQLPPPQRSGCTNHKARRVAADPPAELALFSPSPISGPLSELLPLRVLLVQTVAERRVLSRLLQQHHYLGYGRPVGENAPYLVESRGGQLLGGAVFGAAAWKCAPRDRFIGWSAPARCVLRAISDSDSEANRTAVRSQFGHRSEGIRTGVPAEIRTVFRPLERVSEMGRNNSV
jgi:hypothetical protein